MPCQVGLSFSWMYRRDKGYWSVWCVYFKYINCTFSSLPLQVEWWPIHSLGSGHVTWRSPNNRPPYPWQDKRSITLILITGPLVTFPNINNKHHGHHSSQGPNSSSSTSANAGRPLSTNWPRHLALRSSGPVPMEKSTRMAAACTFPSRLRPGGEMSDSRGTAQFSGSSCVHGGVSAASKQ